MSPLDGFAFDPGSPGDYSDWREAFLVALFGTASTVGMHGRGKEATVAEADDLARLAVALIKSRRSQIEPKR